jgi:hypothetical protein
MVSLNYTDYQGNTGSKLTDDLEEQLKPQFESKGFPSFYKKTPATNTNEKAMV